MCCARAAKNNNNSAYGDIFCSGSRRRPRTLSPREHPPGSLVVTISLPSSIKRLESACIN
ncbi:Uncharacterised protein [Chlamydia trachomatis]|nr:Uncharacterised protein [Chlamydia trachomatis]